MNRGMSLEEDIRRMKDEVFFLRVEKVVLVEDSSDKPFWKYTLDKFVEGRYEFFPFVNHPTYDTTGKSALMKYYSPYANADFMICIDSDYDYLLKNPDISRPFIFQTYTYSFENYICYPQGIKNVLENAFDTEGVTFDFVDYFKKYSEGIYDLLCCSLYSEKLKDGKLTIHECINQAGFIKIEDYEVDLKTQVESIQEFVKPFLEAYQSDTFQQFKMDLKELGLTNETAYLFFNGKEGIKKKFVVPLLQTLGKTIFEKKLSILKQNSDNDAIKEFVTRVNAQNYETRLLAENRSFENCFLYKKLVNDLQILN